MHFDEGEIIFHGGVVTKEGDPIFEVVDLMKIGIEKETEQPVVFPISQRLRILVRQQVMCGTKTGVCGKNETTTGIDIRLFVKLRIVETVKEAQGDLVVLAAGEVIGYAIRRAARGRFRSIPLASG